MLRYVKHSNNFKLLSSTHEMIPNQLPIPEHIMMAGIFVKIKSLRIIHGNLKLLQTNVWLRTVL